MITLKYVEGTQLVAFFYVPGARLICGLLSH